MLKKRKYMDIGNLWKYQVITYNFHFPLFLMLAVEKPTYIDIASKKKKTVGTHMLQHDPSYITD